MDGWVVEDERMGCEGGWGKDNKVGQDRPGWGFDWGNDEGMGRR